MTLNDKLKRLDKYPFHMPGHKRNGKFNLPSYDIDITEIEGLDNLHNPQECLLLLESRYSKLYKSKKSILSVNGSTCGILATISALCNKGDKIIIARNCHKSVYNACFINELRVEYILPSVNSDFNCFDKITQSQIDEMLSQHPDAKAVVITSPTYEGIVSNIECPVPLIIDCAHGAHFGLNDAFVNYPKADVVISSLHKTLPTLTQCAVVNIYNEKYINNIKRYMDIYETSSPSYILMSSMEKCIDYIDNNCFDGYVKLINDFRARVKALNNIQLLDNDDITRICIKSKAISGNQLADVLRNDYKIEAEMSCNDYVILISTVADEEYAFDMLLNALVEIDSRFDESVSKASDNYHLPEKAKECFEINDGIITNIDIAKNCISAEYVFAYPPGIPIIVPGEIIDDYTISYVNNSIINGTNILCDSGLLPHKILTNGKV